MNLSLILFLRKFLLSIILFFMLKIPIKYALSELYLMDYYFLFCGLYSCIFIILLCMVNNKDLPNVLSFITIFTFSVFWAFIFIHFCKYFPLDFIIFTFSIVSPGILFSESVEGSGANTGSGNTIDNSKGSNKSKPKPDLKISTGPTTDVEKDREKIGKCTHDNTKEFRINTEKDADETVCDFVGENGEFGHKAFDSVTDIAFVCDNCQAVMCRDCIEIYSDEE